MSGERKYYSFETDIDCGDIGTHRAEVHGTVTRSLTGAFILARVTAVFLFDGLKQSFEEYLSKEARTDLEEKLEREFEKDQQNPLTGDDL